MSKRRVVITGLGIVSPLGIGVAENWRNITAGRGGIGRVTHFDATGYPSAIAGEVKNFDPAQYVSEKEARRMDRFIQLGMAAAIEAIKDSGLAVTEANAERIGVHIGAGIGGVSTIEEMTLTIKERGPRRVSPFFVPMCIINMISGDLSVMFGLKGPNLSMVTACATATHAVGDAGRLIEYGDADVMIAGGAEAAITPTALAGFGNAKALSTRNDSPETASRPWDKDRDGFVLGEGAGIVVLEEYEHAQRRGARIYCELIGFGMSGDAYHMTSPPADGEGAARCMRNAMRNAGVNPEQVQYINAHGTSTLLGDRAETLAVKTAFGAHAKKLAVSSTKSMTGHLLGAAGGVEAIYTALAIQHQVAPPTINLTTPDPECDLDYVPGSARAMKIAVAVSNSFGFGGTNGTIILRRLM
ncbi:MAG: beta-ketoacyl-[acyl-carrier-protein] synthase II [Candidatus Muproteobacteria bacterium RIFCSPHIGHO2_02_FULL_65_16]|uniref:3-oxoacyl-[acyl-carrier-protein] synthase 2 n=1 Tax=Candidatus Muproteobacteria bacterium RIFCSPHIGHO2_02_FULL_65_16 TaxID=1817766 RepID=A0A1F6U2J3_9PROT|nr:MAG: beta-ketoacyl-[acyl-carrier-protein] synthase II [Candidatus Muproteobacteria bacterium RIFCSPHIGHO2_02_FULL_65_16]